MAYNDPYAAPAYVVAAPKPATAAPGDRSVAAGHGTSGNGGSFAGVEQSLGIKAGPHPLLLVGGAVLIYFLFIKKRA